MAGIFPYCHLHTLMMMQIFNHFFSAKLPFATTIENPSNVLLNEENFLTRRPSIKEVRLFLASYLTLLESSAKSTVQNVLQIAPEKPLNSSMKRPKPQVVKCF